MLIPLVISAGLSARRRVAARISNGQKKSREETLRGIASSKMTGPICTPAESLLQLRLINSLCFVKLFVVPGSPVYSLSMSRKRLERGATQSRRFLQLDFPSFATHCSRDLRAKARWCHFRNANLSTRAIVGDAMPGKGMGVQLVRMRPEDGANLDQFLSRQKVSSKGPAISSAANSKPANSPACRAFP